MNIDNNPIQKRAMELFKQKRTEEALAAQDEFLNEFHAFCEENDHCPCTSSCALHGNCRDCVAVHRAHREHLPVCFHDMINERLIKLSELTENSLKKQI